MKIKTWLLLSYLIVMILPLLVAYLLFAWIQSYHDDQKVEAFLQTSTELQEVKAILDDPNLYKPKAKKEQVNKLANGQRSIALYNRDGLVIYTSNPTLTPAQSGLDREKLYEGLYTLEQGYGTYSYRQPVFEGNELIGFFDVEMARDEWTTAVSDRSWLMFGIFFILFLSVYVAVVLLVNRKLNRRITGLMEEMTAFAHGDVVKESQVNNDEIGKLKKHFYDMRKQINAAQEVIDQEQRKKEYMIASISHDLKTPLTSIKAYAESLENEQELTETEQKEYRKIIMEKSDFMKQMLDDLLTYTLLQSPSYEMQLVQVDGNEFFDMLVSDYEALCKDKNIDLHVNAHVTGMYEVNPKQIMRVADNVMSNAIQHTPQGRNIWVIAISDSESVPDQLFEFVTKKFTFNFEENVYFIVQNEGSGIADNKIAQIFDPLYQEDQARSKRDQHGTGLGLSITKQIIEKHGGDVQIFSEEDIGACVICRLPKLKGDDEGNG